MEERRPNRRQLSARGMKRAPVSTSALLCLLSTGLALNLAPLIYLYTNPNSPSLCFVNWYNLLRTGCCFLNLIATVWTRRARRFVLRYGAWRVFLCGVFIVVSSYIFVAVVLDRSAQWTWKTFEYNFINRLESSVVGIFETRPDFLVREIRSREPIKVERQSRYEGEDVRLVCEDILYFRERVTFHEKQVVWKHNKERIVSSSRYHITTLLEEIPTPDTIKDNSRLLGMDMYTYRVESKLEIYLIESADFGKFSCHVAKTAFPIEPTKNPPSSESPKTQKDHTQCPCPFEDLIHMNFNASPYQWTAEFSLVKIKHVRRNVSIPVGGIVSTSASYLTLEDAPQHTDFDHEINGKSFVKTCEGFDQSCSIFVFLYWFLWHDGGHFSTIPAFCQRLFMVDGFVGTSWQCVCPYTYGVHKFMFYRRFYNRTLGTYQIIEVEYPDTVQLIPEEPNLLDLYYNGSKKIVPLPEPSCRGSVETKACELLEMFLKNLSCSFFYNEKQIFASGLVVCVVLAWIFTRVILTCVTNPCINMILGRRRVNVQPIPGRGTLAGLASSHNTIVKYDLYISYADEQLSLVSDIAQALTLRGFRVCFRDNDVLGGENITQAVSRIITESWKFLVIVSQEYVDSGLQNNFEIHLITQRHREGVINDRSIALLELGPDLIPEVYRSFTILNHYENTDDIVEDILSWHGPSIFPNESYTAVRIIKGQYLRFTSTSVYCVSTVFLYLLLHSFLHGPVW